MRRSTPSPRRVGSGRLEALSDGAFAIVITLLVLEIRRPSGEPGHLGEDLVHEGRPTWPTRSRSFTSA